MIHSCRQRPGQRGDVRMKPPDESTVTHNHISEQQRGADFLGTLRFQSSFSGSAARLSLDAPFSVAVRLSLLLRDLGVGVHKGFLHCGKGLPVEAFDEEVVLQAQLDHRQHGPRQVEGVELHRMELTRR